MMTTEDYQEAARTLRPQLTQTACRYLQDADEAEDAVQDALLRLWQMRDRLTPPIDALAATVVRRLCIDRLRRRPVRDALPETLVAPQDDDETPTRIARMLRLIDALPGLQATLLRLRHVEGREMSDIARLTGSTEVAVRQQLSRARRAVRDAYLQTYRS